jgi:tRNA A-37 threonylcarbamoyl transferase component Bud32
MEIPGYKILGTLGKGGMATVYLAIQESFDRKVAIKVMSPQLAEDPSFGERFQREARIVSQMKHPNIVTVYDVGVVDDHYYLAMEYVEGKELHRRFKEMSLAEKIKAVKDIAAALNYAGNKGYVHRDVKPENVMLCDEDGRAILMDFGIAKTTDSDHSVTKTGMAIGTPYYMSPEQAQGHLVDKRSDIYSLGIMFFQMLTGRVPYDADSQVAIGIKHITEPIPFLSKELRVFQPIIDKVMAKDPEERYQNGAELIKDLEKVDITDAGEVDGAQHQEVLPASGTDPHAATVLGETTPPPAAKKNNSFVVLALALVVLLLAGGGWYLSRPQPQEVVQVIASAPPAPVVDQPAQPVQPAHSAPATPAPVIDLHSDQNNKQDDKAKIDAQQDAVNVEKEKQEADARKAAELKEQEEKEERAKAAALKEQEEQARAAELERQQEQARTEKERAEKERQQAAFLVQQKQQRVIARQQELQQEINTRLDQADQFRQHGHLVSPAGNNALEAYRDILVADPGNGKATQGLKEVESAYLADIRHLIDAGNTSEANNRLREAARLFPNDAQVDALVALQEKAALPVQKAEETTAVEAKVAAAPPQVSRLVINEAPFDTMQLDPKANIPLGRTAYVGFSYQNLESATSLMQAVLYDSSHTVKIIQKPVVVTGAQGNVFFTLARPVEGFPDGGYSLELLLNDQKMISVEFTVKH